MGLSVRRLEAADTMGMYDSIMITALASLVMHHHGKNVIPRFAFEPARPVKQHRITMIGAPAAVDRWDGTIQIFTWRADWFRTKNSVRKEIRSLYPDVTESNGMLYFFGGSNIRFSWGYGNTVGLYRDFRAKPSRIRNLYTATGDLKGIRAKGWVTALVYIDNTFPGWYGKRKYSVPRHW